MTIVKILLLAILSASTVAAQTDHLTSVKIYVNDATNKTIQNVSFSVDRLYKERSELHEFTEVFKLEGGHVVHLGLEARGNFLIKMDAEDYEPLNFQVFFARGHMQTVNVKLKKSGSSEVASIERMTNVGGQLLDHSGNLVPSAKVVALDTNGRRFETTSAPNGYFELSLPYAGFFWDQKKKEWIGESQYPSRYDISFSAPGHKTHRLSGVSITNGSRGRMNFDLVLELAEPSSGAASR